MVVEVVDDGDGVDDAVVVEVTDVAPVAVSFWVDVVDAGDAIDTIEVVVESFKVVVDVDNVNNAVDVGDTIDVGNAVDVGDTVEVVIDAKATVGSFAISAEGEETKTTDELVPWDDDMREEKARVPAEEEETPEKAEREVEVEAEVYVDEATGAKLDPLASTSTSAKANPERSALVLNVPGPGIGVGPGTPLPPGAPTGSAPRAPRSLRSSTAGSPASAPDTDREAGDASGAGADVPDDAARGGKPGEGYPACAGRERGGMRRHTFAGRGRGGRVRRYAGW
ncbi:hypothetical protein CALVIDRAFT_537458 [Calocera viscosa TUFC12733]|uniref:Uncharacterized protein n=1 Tax=Calocera viscosa (strain TUFC12733) TaxID=1330018 RepID=A0A167M341_CALVF|nr:hypothetical protein CALVIDRAFT_537458 [Calocera viscosa TUFC12733]